MPTTPHPSRSPGLPFIFVTLLIDLLGLGLTIPVMPALIARIGGLDQLATTHVYGLLIGLAALAQFLCAPLLGTLSDRFGRRPVLLLSVAGSALSMLLIAFAPSLGWLFAARVLSGMSGASVPVANAYIADISTPETRARNFGMVGAAYGFGLILGPMLGGLLGSINTQLPFLAAAGLAALNFIYGLLILPESHPVERRVKQLALSSLNPLGSLATLRKLSGAWCLIILMTLGALSTQLVTSTWVLYGMQRYHWQPGEAGFSLAISGVISVLGQVWLLRVLLGKLSERRTLLLALTVGALTMPLLGLANQTWLFYAVIALSVGSAPVGPILQSLLARSVPAAQQGAVQGALASLSGLMAVVGPLSATALLAHFTRAQAGVMYLPGINFFVSGGLIVLGLLLTLTQLKPVPSPARPIQENPA